MSSPCVQVSQTHSLRAVCEKSVSQSALANPFANDKKNMEIILSQNYTVEWKQREDFVFHFLLGYS